MSHERISLNSVFLLLLVNFVSVFRLELINISLIVSIRPNHTHLDGFQQFVLLSQFIEITFFAFTNRINILNLKLSSDRLVILAKGFSKLPNLHMLLKQKSSSLPRNLALRTVRKSLTVFSAKVNLLYLLYSTAQRCYLLHLIKENHFLKKF